MHNAYEWQFACRGPMNESLCVARTFIYRYIHTGTYIHI